MRSVQVFEGDGERPPELEPLYQPSKDIAKVLSQLSDALMVGVDLRIVGFSDAVMFGTYLDDLATGKGRRSEAKWVREKLKRWHNPEDKRVEPTDARLKKVRKFHDDLGRGMTALNWIVGLDQ